MTFTSINVLYLYFSIKCFYFLLVFQSRAIALNKQIADLHDQLEQSRIQCETFDMLRKQEKHAIPRRLTVSIQEVEVINNCCFR